MGEIQTQTQTQAENSDSDESDAFTGGLHVGELLAYMMECKRVYATSACHQRFMETARKCYPDMLKYILALEPVLTDLQRPILKSKGFIENEDENTVQDARSRIAGSISAYWSGSHEVRKISEELTALAKL